MESTSALQCSAGSHLKVSMLFRKGGKIAEAPLLFSFGVRVCGLLALGLASPSSPSATTMTARRRSPACPRSTRSRGPGAELPPPRAHATAARISLESLTPCHTAQRHAPRLGAAARQHDVRVAHNLHKARSLTRHDGFVPPEEAYAQAHGYDVVIYDKSPFFEDPSAACKRMPNSAFLTFTP